jgi:asparagine synthase (glutamine-hydrolysing)
VDQPKYGFTVPLADWFRADLADRYRDSVLTPDARLRDHLDQSVASEMLDEHERGLADHGHRLWLLLIFELWARRWLTNAPGSGHSAPVGLSSSSATQPPTILARSGAQTIRLSDRSRPGDLAET